MYYFGYEIDKKRNCTRCNSENVDPGCIKTTSRSAISQNETPEPACCYGEKHEKLDFGG
jgi:hypothetical protein